MADQLEGETVQPQLQNTRTEGTAETVTINMAGSNEAVTTAGPALLPPPAPKVQAWPCPKCGRGWNVPDPMPVGAVASCPECRVQLVAPQVKRTRVAIVGFADSWPMAPFHNLTWDVWCLNQFYDLAGPKINFKTLVQEGRLTWFEQHRRHDLENDPNVIGRHPHHLAKLVELGCPVWMQQHFEDIPLSREYPLKRMTERFGGYWTNSISYMIALAIDQGYREIGLYGVNMAQDQEWAYQRPSCEYFAGFARGLGITVHIPTQSDLLKAPYLYGYEDDKANATLAKLDQLLKEHEANRQNHQRQADEQAAYAQQFNGAIQQIQGFKRLVAIGR